jgi:hypothetical protein
MSVLPRTDPLNVAQRRRRHPPLSWLLLGGSVLLGLASLWPLQQSLASLGAAQAQQREFNRASKRQADELRRKKFDGSNAAAQERDNAQRQIQEFVHLSWDGIFDALEVAAHAVRSGVSIVALTPSKVQPNSVQLSITALASNTPIMLAYLSALKSDPRVQQVELASQQPDDKNGPGVVRFQFNVVCNPKIQVEHPARPTLAASATPATPSATTGTAPNTSLSTVPTPVRPNAPVPPSILQGAKRP